jgi:hypothetical protein
MLPCGLEIQTYVFNMHKGLGDTIASVAEILKNNLPIKLENCNCEKRRVLLNEIFPYPWVTRTFIVEQDFVIKLKEFKQGEILKINNKHELYQRTQYLVESHKLKEL